jgi:hypothetical protein
MYIGIAYQIIYLGIVYEYWQVSIGSPENGGEPILRAINII